jgi:hypothetical protein
VSLQEHWREQADAIREKATPIQTRVDEIKARLKRASEFEGEALLTELVQLNRQISAMALEASNCDMMARGDLAGLR